MPLLRGGLAELGFAGFKKRSTAERRGGTTSRCWRGRASRNAGRAAADAGRMRGRCADGGATTIIWWQRGVRVREMLLQAGTDTPRAKERLLAGGHELNRIAEVIGRNTCTVSDIERLIGEIAPFELAEEWDNVGLLFGRRNAEVTRVVVALDLTQAAVD